MKNINSEKYLQSFLKDSGCDKATREKYLSLVRDNNIDEQVRLLKLHRVKLLDKLHRIEKSIDCVDYVVRELSCNKEN